MKPNDTENTRTASRRRPSPLADDAANGGRCRDRADPIAALEAEKTELKDKFLRLMADMENLRRRTEREVADARTYAVTNFARDMLNVADNVRRAHRERAGRGPRAAPKAPSRASSKASTSPSATS